jgi:hypothetical protein
MTRDYLYPENVDAAREEEFQKEQRRFKASKVPDIINDLKDLYHKNCDGHGSLHTARILSAAMVEMSQLRNALRDIEKLGGEAGKIATKALSVSYHWSFQDKKK